MNQNRLFRLTRTRLAVWYAVVMGFILSLCGVAVYRAIAHTYWITLERELESVAGTLHDGIEPTLKYPGRLEPTIRQLLPDICLAGVSCIQEQPNSRRHILGAIHKGDYYMRLFDNSGRLIATAGVYPEGLSLVLNKKLWQTLQDTQGNRYHLISLTLHTRSHLDWGYIQVGRSLKDFDNHLAMLRWILGLGLPMAMGLIGVSGWWLAGLAMQPIHKSYQQMQQFTADAAHELRTPLAALQATVESTPSMHEFPPLEAQAQQQTIERQVNRLSQIVKDLLLLCRMDQQVLSVKNLPCCLNDLISDLVEEFEELAIAADIKLTSDMRVHQDLYVTGDVEQLYRLVSNLIANAIQYTPAGGLVSVILNSSNDYALIQIQDTGIGIAPEDRERIFDRFYRVNSDRSRRTGGSGLGLAIARAIVQAHDGSLQVQSELGKGSTFTIRLPLGTTPPESQLKLGG